MDRLWDLLQQCDALYDTNPGRGDISQMHHCWNCAWQAYSAGASSEMMTVALFHDVGKVVDEIHHAEVVADVLRGRISDDALQVLLHHGDFQAAPNFVALQWSEERWFDQACEFAIWDAQAFTGKISYTQRVPILIGCVL